MKIGLESGKIFVDQVRVGFYEVLDGAELTPGSYVVEARYSHHHGKVMPHIESIGWIGSSAGCAIVLGHVRGRTHLIPDGRMVRILSDSIETAEETGMDVFVEVK